MSHRTRSQRALVATVLAVALGAVGAAAEAGADIGFTGESRTSASPGETVRVSIGCGFCLPRCVGRPGHRHPPGRLDGTCILGGGPRWPPTGFPVWLTAAARPLGPYPPASCRPGEACPPAQRPPRLPSFTYLGRAGGVSYDKRAEVPRYVLRFQVPDVAAGRYMYVLYCGRCVEGPGGIRVESAVYADGRLGSGVLTVDEGGGSGDAGAPLIAAGIAAAIVLPGLGLWMRRRR